MIMKVIVMVSVGVGVSPRESCLEGEFPVAMRDLRRWDLVKRG